MFKKLKIKKILSLLLVLLLSVNSFISHATSNDGSSFITKAEFDSLKNTFQSQLDEYNKSIDSKIDAAIAAYLAQPFISKVELDSLLNLCKNLKFGVNTNFGLDPNVPGKYRQVSFAWDHATQNLNSTLTGTVWQASGFETKDSSTNKGNYWIVHPSTFDNSKYEFDYLLTDSYPVAAAGGNIFIARNWAYAGSTVAPNGTWELTPYVSSTGVQSATLRGQFQSTATDTINGAYSMTWNETKKDANLCLASGAMTTGNKTNVLVEDLFTVGALCATDNPPTTLFWYMWSQEGSIHKNSVNATNFKLSSYNRWYNHNTDVSVDTIIHPTTSSVYGKSLTYYEGMPIVKVSDAGDLTFKIKATNTESGNTYIQIKSGKFANEAITRGISVTGVKSIKVLDDTGVDVTSTWDGIIGHGKTLSFKLTGVPMGTDLFIKAQPVSATAFSSFETVDSIIMEITK